MDAIGLHQRVVLIDMQQQERHELDVVLSSQIGENSGERSHVFRAIVRRQSNSQQNERDVRLLDMLNHLVEIVTRGFDRNAAETVVTAEFEQDEDRFSGDDVVDARETVAGGVSADALVLDAVAIALRIKQILQGLGIAAAGNPGG